MIWALLAPDLYNYATRCRRKREVACLFSSQKERPMGLVILSHKTSTVFACYQGSLLPTAFQGLWRTVATAYVAWEFAQEQCNETGWRAGRRRKQNSVSGRDQDFPLFQNLQPSSGVHSAAYSVSNTCSSTRVMRSEREANHSFPSGADFKNDGNLTSSATYVSVAFAVS